MNAEISGGVNSRSPRPILHDAAGLAGHAERQQARLVADVVEAFAHEALDRVHGTRGVGQQTTLRFAADVDGAVFGRADTTDGTSASSLRRE